MARVIRELVEAETYRSRLQRSNKADALQIASSKYVIVVEHDLTILDDVSDYVCCMYGEPGAYGVVTGINQFIEGYIKAEG